jgi:hypothetical protein
VVTGCQLLRGQVDPQADRRARAAALPTGGQIDRLVEHPVAEHHHQTGGFGRGQERTRHQQTVGGMLPPHQRFDAHDLA